MLTHDLQPPLAGDTGAGHGRRGCRSAGSGVVTGHRLEPAASGPGGVRPGRLRA